MQALFLDGVYGMGCRLEIPVRYFPKNKIFLFPPPFFQTMGAEQIGKKNKKYFSISLKKRHY
jgi:hypothetical protein